MFFAGSSFESPFGPLFDLVLRPFSNNISTKMPTEGPKRRSRGAWRGGLILRSLRASSRKVSDPGGGLPEGPNQCTLPFRLCSKATQKNDMFAGTLCFVSSFENDI